MHGCNIFTCNKSHVGWHVGGQRHSSHHPTIRSSGLISTFSCNFWRCVIRQYSCHDITMLTFEHLTAHYFLSQRHFLFQSSISCFCVCNLYIFLLGKECKVQKLQLRQDLNTQPSDLNSGALSTELWGLSVLNEFFLYLKFLGFL